MKINANNENNHSCEIIQLSISDAIDANENLNRADNQHIESCAECAKFQQLWETESPVSAIASGPLTEQQDLIQPIISQLEQNAKIVPLKSNNVIKAKFFQLASIAAIIAIVSAFSFYRIDEDKPNVVDIKTPASKEVLNIKIPTITLTLTEAEIEKSLEENYQNLSQSATEKWKATTTNFARATEYIANGTHYISAKYLNPINNESTGPQS
jgi:hypothetical protein|tara:strand:+ start:369 stop:1004 length:636 start_codon:yes stop_codon:yes gene_type:complete